jgi:hypothetical protein
MPLETPRVKVIPSRRNHDQEREEKMLGEYVVIQVSQAITLPAFGGRRQKKSSRATPGRTLLELR